MSEALVDAKALVALEYDGRSYRPGEWFKARAVDALTLGQAGRVSLTREYATRATTTRSTAAEKPGKRSYKRRDLTAESS